MMEDDYNAYRIMIGCFIAAVILIVLAAVGWAP